MYKEIETMSVGLVVWQLILLIILIFGIYLFIKLFKKINNLMDLKIKYLKKKMDEK